MPGAFQCSDTPNSGSTFLKAFLEGVLFVILAVAVIVIMGKIREAEENNAVQPINSAATASAPAIMPVSNMQQVTITAQSAGFNHGNFAVITIQLILMVGLREKTRQGVSMWW